MGNQRDLIGEKFGRLTVVAKSTTRLSNGLKTVSAWDCLCECGSLRPYRKQSLISGQSKSCGCAIGRVAKTPLTQERLRNLLDYEPTTGFFRWRVRHGHAMPGDIAGCPHGEDRWQIVLDKKHYKAHRLAWFYVYGEWPGTIDHINRDARDNRIENLRTAEGAQNNFNSVHDKGATGYRGVCFYKNRYMAQISHNGKSLYIGRFKTAEDAYAAWCETAERLRGEFVCTE